VAVDEHQARRAAPAQRKQVSQEDAVVPAEHDRERAVVQDLADHVRLLPGELGDRLDVGDAEDGIALRLERRGAEGVEDLRADQLGKAQLDQGRAETLDASGAKPEIRLDMQDLDSPVDL
jgi:hypothetical protein